MANVTMVIGGDDPGEIGLWEGDKMIATLGHLEREGYSEYYLMGLSQKKLSNLARKLKRDAALPVSVERGNLEDWLG